MSAICILAIAFSLGVCLGNAVPVPFGAAIFGLVSGSILVSLAAFTSHRLVATTFISVIFVVGWIRPFGAITERGSHSLQAPCVRLIEGRIAFPPVQFEDMWRLTLDLERWSPCLTCPKVEGLTSTNGRLYVTVMSVDHVPFQSGDTVRLRAIIKPSLPARNRGVPIRGLSMPHYMAIVDSPSAISMIKVGSGPVDEIFDSTRNEIASFWRSNLDPDEASLARALTLGESSVLRQELRDRFQRTGTSHILSVSGLHLGLVVLFVFLLLKKVLLRVPSLVQRLDVGRLAALASLPVAVSFTFLTGFRVPVIRACIMVASALIARAVYRNSASAEALAIALFALLSFDPEAVTNAGFQLSFGAVLSFIVIFKRRGEERIREALQEKKEISKKKRFFGKAAKVLVGIFRSCVAAYAVTTPLVLYHFNYVSVVGVVVNLLAVPFVGFVILPFLLIVAVVSRVSSFIAELLCLPLGPMLSVFNGFLEFFAGLPCSIENPGPILICAVVSFCVSIIAFFVKQTRFGVVVLLGAVGLVIVSRFADPPSFPFGKFTIDFLDVGQGDAALLTLPGGKHWLVDAGGAWSRRSNAGTNVVVPMLRANGVETIDTLVLTHPDLDHVGGMGAVIESIKTERIFENGQGVDIKGDKSYLRLMETARLLRVPIFRPPKICKTFRYSSVEIEVVSPCPKTGTYYQDRSSNDNSIVLYIRHGGIGFVLTGDIGRATEEVLVNKGLLGNADVLKLSHHGSNTSNGRILLDAVRPRIAIASVGLFNRHRFPHSSVRKRLRSRGIRLLGTDRLGGIRVISDGNTLELETVEVVR